MQPQSSVFGGAATSLALRYTGKPVSGWGGLVAVMRYLERRGVRRVLEGALPDGRTSPNQIPVVDLVLAFLAGVLTGSRRFARDEEGQLKISRTYTFEFSDTGNNRRHGAIVMLGGDVADMHLEPYRMQ